MYIIWITGLTTSGFALKDCLFGVVKLSKIANLDESNALCSGYVTRFNWLPLFQLKTLIGVNLPLIRKNYISIFSEGQTQGLDDNTITAEAKYSTNITKLRNKLCLDLCHNGNSRLFVCLYGKNISIKSKRIWNKTIFIVFKQYLFQKILELITWKTWIKWIGIRFFCRL